MYSTTFFGKIPMTMYASGISFGRVYWLHSYVKILQGFVPMNRKNTDGSISVLGMEYNIISNLSWGNRNKKSMQKSLKLHADKLREAGAVIIKQTKNTLVARKDRETAVFSISPLSAETFYKKLHE